MSEFRDEPQPPLEELARRLKPVDILIAEGFKHEAIPTLEVFVRARHKEPRCNANPNILALIAEEPIETRVPRFHPEDTDA